MRRYVSDVHVEHQALDAISRLSDGPCKKASHRRYIPDPGSIGLLLELRDFFDTCEMRIEALNLCCTVNSYLTNSFMSILAPAEGENIAMDNTDGMQ